MADTLDIASAATAPTPYPGAGGLPADPSASIAAAAADPVGRDRREQEGKEKAALGTIEKAYEAKIRAVDALEWGREHQDEQVRARMDRMANATAASAEELERGAWKPEDHYQPTNLWEAFGSPGFLIAMMGSAFSAMPMNSALAAGGAALEAIHRGDDAAYERAFKAWQENTKLVLERAKIEEAAFNEFDHLRTTDLASWRAKAEASALKFNDQRGLALLRAGMDDTYLTAKRTQTETALQLEKYYQGINENKELVDYNKTLDDADAAKNATGRVTPEQHFKNFTKAKSELEAAKASGRGAPSMSKEEATTMENVKSRLRREHPDWDSSKIDTEAAKETKQAYATPLSTADQAKYQLRIKQYDHANETIDRILEVLKRPAAAGLAGKAMRLEERLANILGSQSTERVTMMREIEKLRLEAPQLLLNRAGRPLRQEASEIAAIVPGLDRGDLQQNTIDGLKRLKENYSELKSDIEGVMPAGTYVRSEPKKETSPGGGWDMYPRAD